MKSEILNIRNIKRIVLTGAESTGKTTLTKQLADYYHTVWVPEYAREYVEKLNRPYGYKDIVQIAKKQIVSENKYLRKTNKYLFLDTALIIIKIWFSYKYKRVPEWLLLRIRENKYDLHLLCDSDIPWIDEPVRENQELRKYLSDLYLKELENNNFPYCVIAGKGEIRLQKAIKSIDQYFERKLIPHEVNN